MTERKSQRRRTLVRQVLASVGLSACWIACSGSGAPAPEAALNADEPALSPGSGGETGAAGAPEPGMAGGPGEGNPNPVGIAGKGAAEPSAQGSDAGVGDAAPEVPPRVVPFDGSFILGADISSIPEVVDDGTVFVDTDGQQKSMLELLANHGFNYVRLRTFVNPSSQYGYASSSSCPGKAQAYADKAHTVAFAREIKAAGMGLLLDFHHSDTWADPGKQVIPEAWRGLTSVEELAGQVRAYTLDVLGDLVAAGATPDMVQVGNEITPGMLIHVPTANTDCYGNGSVPNLGVNGSRNDWDNLALLLRAGIEATREAVPGAKVMLHIENTGNPGGVVAWVQDALSRGVSFDVLGLSAYEAFQGPSSAWRGTLNLLADTFPELSFAIAEYNPERRLLNDIMRELPDGRGLGTFFWEPTQSGSWGSAMFDWQGNRLVALPADFAQYDQMRSDFGLP